MSTLTLMSIMRKISCSTAFLVALLLAGCGKSSDDNSSKIAVQKEDNSIYKWIKEETKDAFDDSEFVRFSLSSEGGSGSEFLLVDCNKQKNIRFNWQYGAGSKGAPYGPMDMPVSIRLDDGAVTQASWEWAANNPMLRPKEPVDFLEKLVGKSKVALKEDTTGQSAVFNIQGFDVVYKYIKVKCQQPIKKAE